MTTVWELFLTFLKIGLLSIGGGYAIIPLIQEQVVNQAGWISQKTFTDIITISQMTPGPPVSYTHLVRTLFVMEFMISLLGAFIITSLVKFVGNVRLAFSTPLNSSSSRKLGSRPNKRR